MNRVPPRVTGVAECDRRFLAVVLCAPQRALEILGFAAEGQATNRLLDAGLHPPLDFGGAVPPAALPEGLADDVAADVAAHGEGRAIGVDDGAVEVEPAGEKPLVVDGLELVVRCGEPRALVVLEFGEARELRGVLDAVERHAQIAQRDEVRRMVAAERVEDAAADDAAVGARRAQVGVARAENRESGIPASAAMRCAASRPRAGPDRRRGWR